MALSGNALGDAMLAAVNAVGPPNDGESSAAYRQRVFRAQGVAIVDYIKANAVVTVPVTGTDTGLQSYVVPPGAAIPTLGPLAPTTLDGTIA